VRLQAVAVAAVLAGTACADTDLAGNANGGVTISNAVPSFAALAGEHYLKASSPRSQDDFGQSVALSADGNLMAIGAPSQESGFGGVNNENESDVSAPQAGAVYVFATRGDGTWSQEAYIKASNPRPSCQFGASVSLSGDGRTLVVGAPGEPSAGVGVDSPLQTDTSAPSSGAAYIFSRTAGRWSQAAYIKASNARTLY
jgi:trimeric autotransporter adhesin